MIDICSFDIEIYNEILDGENIDPFSLIPSVAAYCTDVETVTYFYDTPHMTKETARQMCEDLISLDAKGIKIFGWNILSFDFPVLANWAGMLEEMGSLAFRSIDPMFTLYSLKGHFLGLDSALIGANIETKLHQVSLNDGTTLFAMSGDKAPKLWRNGEINAVKDYLAYDVWQSYKLAGSIVQNGGIKWSSKSGKHSFVRMGLETVKEAMEKPVPNQSQMTNPKKREDFYSWIPKTVLHNEGVL
jgi:hypothetical protein